MFAEGINVSESWKEALDDGSLTLAAETFLLALPSDQVPVFTCLYAPSVLNIITSLRPTGTPNLEEAYYNLDALSSLEKKSPYGSAMSHSVVSKEIQRLKGWLSSQISEKADTKQAA